MKLSDIMDITNSIEESNFDDPSYVMESADSIKKNVDLLIAFCLLRNNIILKNQNIDEYKQVCMRKFTNFHQKYPTLFFTIVENPTSFPLYRLNEMLSHKRKIEENESNKEKISKQLGEKYYDEFVKDTVFDLDKKIKKN
jgi:hypothetical protein